MKITIKNQEKIIEKVEKAEILIKELKQILAWDLPAIEIEVEEEKSE